ncbi:hypothetical protein CPAST_c05380 [Clostridium pasteurianum DSM 525 = ATCC 6013]|uniref:Uncharacterized protein n=1 Tax=Clostridium pasteurianum DSM 525 = ATCC 6013 TaxID=1262449 RepID=A0A0H3J407_CLOPA|nr:hypothetical protein [Clostridium pasteurianum]AJA46638.1 hypothetical protein CPAST_c05380 [Clostridium pasteurianum DSM 525 = ATCC 6013]AJA50626.1 hypothetical protein CLPA_c05380 [Clostridium pasteurianum DSM 525 = ATCC 6013]ELP61203.1 hypothetical protein F502_02070 [Clostridium pasteurianum DSM 525 = ATCC 6013]KRU13362.1 hypothetical protein CP6013_02610 [Clostridium pasteurianum DSM 525 = ATCC 6013]UZW14809.1 hypothetical protein OSC52_02895 [Clostridium pasteurianum]
MDKEILEILKRLELGQNELKKNYASLELGQKELKENYASLERGQSRLEVRLNETYEIVRTLEHSAEVSKAEHDKMNNDIVHIKGNVEGLRKDLSTVEIVTANNYADIAKLKAIK